MQSLRACARRGLCAGVLSLAVFSYAAPVPVPVSVTQDDANFTLSNAWCTAKVSKRTGDLVSLKFKGIETMGFASGHHAGYWEQNPSSAANLSATVTIDPAANKGERGEVSVKGVGGRTPFDLEIRYTMGRDDHGVYTYAIFSHEPSYPAGQIGESRFGAKLNGDVFDWMSIDAKRNGLMPKGYDWAHGTPLNMKEARRLTTGVHAGEAEHNRLLGAAVRDPRLRMVEHERTRSASTSSILQRNS